MRIKTSNAMRQVDRWKLSVAERYRRFKSSLYFLLIAVGHRRQFILPTIFTLWLSVHFAVFEFASLVVLGALLLKLNSFRLANTILRGLTRTTRLI
jgi:hypothetical protein